MQVVLLTRNGCGMCERAANRLAELSDELGFDLTITDVDAEAAAGATPRCAPSSATGCRWCC